MSSATLEVPQSAGLALSVPLVDRVQGSLAQRRVRVHAQWRRFRNQQSLSKSLPIDAEVLASWQRSACEIPTYQLNAPSEETLDTRTEWQQSMLLQATKQLQADIVQLADEGDLLAGVTDTGGRLLWGYSGSRLREAVDRINFKLGSRWDEATLGTHAVGLALKLQRAVTVFSCEHFQPFMHDWVSYAAPIRYPHSAECAGILTLAAAWNRHTPLGEVAASGMAHAIGERLPRERPRAELEIHALGQPRVLLRGKPLQLPLRQIEILCLLALNARGLNLEAFHAALYGDAPVSLSTLKAELSHLRRLLGGKIGSRPYRLQLSVWADFIEIWQTLRRKRSGEAFALYRGPLLFQSESPELEEWRRCIDAVMGQALGSCDDPLVLMSKLCQGAGGSEQVRERLGELMQRS